ncbi:hypothetical protein [Pseudomonas haemolytica]|uniref:Uncharacterized protein n=1 Tax=Pseudomonas haemolytica TaxID=2600065 RepID=A0ABS1GXZ2_9PSED|nr:hypothetical protein [Pseudomonas haemolytica]MBK3461623.1 hypothetical protein [Pseudomonas haemolytica]
MFFSLVMGLLLGAFLTFFFFLSLFAFSPDLAQLINPLVVAVLKDVGGPVAAGFGGAIAGAVCSYLFQQRNEREKEAKAEISAAHKTCVRLSVQLNDLFSIKKHNIYPSLDHQARFLDISKIPSNPSVTDQVDPRIIDFAVSLKNAEAIDTIYLAESRYRACFENFRNRNLGLDEYRATSKAAGYGRGGSHTLKQLNRIVGQGQLVALHIMTESMIEVLDEAIQTLRNAIELVADMVDKKYKGTGVLNLKMKLQENEQYLAVTAPPYFDAEKLKVYLAQFEGK